MNLSLSLLAYGTLIPDLRTVLYQHNRTVSVGSVIYEAERFLQDWTGSQPEPSDMTALKELYEPIAPDGELTELICDANFVGATVRVFINPKISTNHHCRETLGKYIRNIPLCASVLEGKSSTWPVEAESGIIVARQLKIVEKAIDQGYQAILYESADRLRRELELRGYAIPARNHAVNS